MAENEIRENKTAAALALFMALDEKEKAIYLERLNALANKRSHEPDLQEKVG